jgi:hypothetical protein
MKVSCVKRANLKALDYVSLLQKFFEGRLKGMDAELKKAKEKEDGGQVKPQAQ